VAGNHGIGEGGSVKVEVKGLRELEQQLDKLTRAGAKGAARRASLKALQPMADLAASLAPDDASTPVPDLHTSIKVSTKVKAGRSLKRVFEGPTQVNTYMGPTAEGYPQAIYQEFGTVKMQPRPYMRPAWDQDRLALLGRLKANLWDEVTKSISRAAARAARLKAKG
jgi:HK97 gp10 family phage protein